MPHELAEEDVLEVKLPVKRCTIGKYYVDFESWVQCLSTDTDRSRQVKRARGFLRATTCTCAPDMQSPCRRRRTRHHHQAGNFFHSEKIGIFGALSNATVACVLRVRFRASGPWRVRRAPPRGAARTRRRARSSRSRGRSADDLLLRSKHNPKQT